jgi:CRP-like cAMP-binding protein
MMNLIEKALALQEVDVFADVSTENLGFLAGITSELRIEEPAVLYRENQLPDSMFVIVEGRVALGKSGRPLTVAGPKDVLGAWALFDQEPHLSTARAEPGTVVLKLEREAFFDLLADHMSITQGILKALARRVRRLAGAVGGSI